MQILKIVLIIYGIMCLYIGLLKPPFIWNIKKLRIMSKMFKGDRNLQIFVLIWGTIALVIGLIL
jgi:hypothetical protein